MFDPLRSPLALSAGYSIVYAHRREDGDLQFAEFGSGIVAIPALRDDLFQMCKDKLPKRFGRDLVGVWDQDEFAGMVRKWPVAVSEPKVTDPNEEPPLDEKPAKPRTVRVEFGSSGLTFFDDDDGI